MVCVPFFVGRKLFEKSFLPTPLFQKPLIRFKWQKYLKNCIQTYIVVCFGMGGIILSIFLIKNQSLRAARTQNAYAHAFSDE
jgi:hypothetical protein